MGAFQVKGALRVNLYASTILYLFCILYLFDWFSVLSINSVCLSVCLSVCRLSSFPFRINFQYFFILIPDQFLSVEESV